MLALNRSSRAALAACAFASFAGSFVTAPFTASGAAGITATPLARVTPRAASREVADAAPHRDPFAGQPAVASQAAPVTPTPATALAALPPFASIPGTIRPLPPNAGAAGGGLPFGPQSRVTALVTGPHPFALIDEAGTTRVVTTGDRVDGDTITRIDAAGVRLARGTTLALAPPATPLLTEGRLP